MKNETVEVAMEKENLNKIIDFVKGHQAEFACVTIGYLAGQLHCHNKLVKAFKKMFNV